MIKEIQLDVSLSKLGQLEASLSKPEMCARLGQHVLNNKDYNLLVNKPSINDVTLIGDLTLEDLSIISEGTTEDWNSHPEFIPKKGQLIVYTDYSEDGPGLKIGDGLAYVVDLPFISGATTSGEIDELRQMLLQHIANNVVHITAQERDSWDSKVSCYVNGQTLIFVSDLPFPEGASGNSF